MALTVAFAAVLMAMGVSAACYHRDTYPEVTKNPTCYSTGTMVVICEDCGVIVKTQTIKMESHDLESKWTVTVEATCYREGERQKKCTNEGCSYVETDEIDKKSHSFASWVTEREATCYREGLKTRTCKNDGCGYVEEKEISEKSHSLSSWTTTREATCYREGLKERYCKNDGCDEEEYDEISKKSHSWSSWETTVESTCYREGKKERYCKNDGCSQKEYDDLSKKSHSWSTWTTTREATCSNEGEKMRYCKHDGCGAEESEEISKKKHSYGSWETVRKATCDEEGLKQRVCKECGYKELSDIAQTKHDWGKWKIIEEAYEDKDGIRSRECEVCGEIQTEKVEVFCGDDYTYKVTKAATCTTNGERIKYCANELSNGKTCGKNHGTEVIKAKGHTWTDWKEVVAPTATSEGKEKRTCKVSTCRQEETRTTRLGHGESWQTKVTKEATCLEEGKKEDICDCCGEALRTVTIPKKNHTYPAGNDTWIIKEVATPEKNGIRYKNCTTPGCTKQNVEYYPWDDGTVATNMPFHDVKPVAWYFENVKKCYSHGLIKGTSDTMYSPSGEITIGQVITLAVRIHCSNNPDVAKPETDTKPWYKGYVDYAVENSIIRENDFTDMNKPATRGEMAYIFASASDEDNLQKINNYKSIPDVSEEHKYSEEIFLLYNAGIVEGNEAGLYQPEAKITRAESATIIARICNYSSRKLSTI